MTKLLDEVARAIIECEVETLDPDDARPEARAALQTVAQWLREIDDKVLSEAYGYTDFSLPKECGGGTREGCVKELRIVSGYIASHLEKEMG